MSLNGWRALGAGLPTSTNRPTEGLPDRRVESRLQRTENDIVLRYSFG